MENNQQSILEAFWAQNEAFVNQDYIPQREIPLSCIARSNFQYEQLSNPTSHPWLHTTPDSFTEEEIDFFAGRYNLTVNQKKILFLYLVLNKTQSQIANQLNVSRQAIHRTLKRIYNKIQPLHY